MKASIKKNKWTLLLVTLPLVLIFAIALATSGPITAGAAQYGYGSGCVQYGGCDIATPSSYGLSDQLLYVANGNASNVAIIDMGAGAIVDYVEVPRAPGGLEPIMFWEIHGVVPSADRASIYAVGALSGTAESSKMYQVDVATDAEIRRIDLTSSLVGYCGLEYEQNDTSSDNLIATNMQSGNGVTASLETLFGMPPGSLPSGQGGWNETSLSAGATTNHISLDFDGDTESSTCGISWNAAGTTAYGSLMWDPATVVVDWGTRTPTAQVAANNIPGAGYHQNTSAKSRDLVFNTGGSTGDVEVFDMTSNALVASIDIASLTGAASAEVHGIEIVPGNDNLIYVMSRQVPDPSGSAILVVDVTDLNAPALIGGVTGLNDAACGVFADADKSMYYSHVNSDDVALIANGNDSNVAVADLGSMSISRYIDIPRAPGGLEPIMFWEIHGVVPSADSTSVYAVGALSGTAESSQMYEVNSATSAPVRTIGLTSSLVGYCGLEYEYNDINSDDLIATNMQSGNGVTASLETLFGLPPGSLPSGQGGWQETSLSAGASTAYTPLDFDGDTESSTCGISWNAAGTTAYGSLMWDPATVVVDWGTRTPTAQVAAYPEPGAGYHQNTSAKSRDLVFNTGGSTGDVEVFDMTSGALVGDISIALLTGSATAEVHGVEIAPGDDNTLYVMSRQVPDPSQSALLVVDVTDIAAPSLKGAVNGLNDAACGVYVLSKAQWDPGEPALSLSKGATYWASMADYTNGILSVDFAISNAGPAAADATIVGTVNTNGVMSVNTPSLSQDIAGGASGNYTVEYQVGGASNFKTTVYAQAQSGATVYNFPGAYPGP